MNYEKVLGEHKFPTYEELKNGLLQLIDEGKISREDAARLLPELREGEDEVIRKAIIELLKEVEEDETYTGRQHIPDMLSYLEKQKEASKAIEAVDRIDKYIDEHLANAHDMKDSNPDKKYYRGWDDALGKMAGILQDVYSEEKQKEQKLAEWSEEDEKQLDDIISIIRGAYEHGITISETRHRNAYFWLNNLRPSWKPSEEQKALMNGLRILPEGENNDILLSLYEHLKKLM